MKEAYIRFFAPVIPQTADLLFKIFDSLILKKYQKVHLMISSPGGSVFHGISIYNYLKGAPIEVETYNFGSVDSIGVIIYCSGRRRYSVPHSRFLIHGVKFNINGNAAFDEKEMDEHFKSLKIDQQNIAKIIADTCGKKIKEIEKNMIERTTLNPEQAKKFGLVHEVKSDLFPVDAEIYYIRELPDQPQQIPFNLTQQKIQAFTQSIDLQIGT